MQEITTTACPHSEAVGKRWGDPISMERQQELQGYVDRWKVETDHGERKGPFADVRLGGADVFWLAQRVCNENSRVPDLHLEGATLIEAHLEGAHLREAHLEHTDLERTRLEQADLREARLEYAHFYLTHLEVATLARAHLEGADLRGAFFSVATNLSGVVVFDEKHGSPQLADVRWQGVNLAVISWPETPTLGDERVARELEEKPLTSGSLADATRGQRQRVKVKTQWRENIIDAWRAAARACRQLASVMRDQGMSDEADRFTYRAQVCQRRLLRKQRKIGAYLFSLFLATLTGYGYRLERILIGYAVVILGFAAAFFALGQSGLINTRLDAGQAIIESLAAFHERAFSGFLNGAHLDPVRGWVAFAEAVVGLVIESTFVAMLVQRLRAGSSG
jgi:hypothetical protein